MVVKVVFNVLISVFVIIFAIFFLFYFFIMVYGQSELAFVHEYHALHFGADLGQ